MTAIFFGSGPVAAESLAQLRQWCDIEAVITKPRPPHHRGPVPVLDTCPDAYTVSTRQELSDLCSAQGFKSRVGIVIDFGIIVAQDVIDRFELGIINSHFSLLPEWRGADPITFAVLSGQERTGISLMRIDARMDEGPLLAQADYEMDDTITTPILTADLIELSDAALRTVLPAYVDGDIVPVPQLESSIADSKTPSYSRKLSKADATLDFMKPAAQLAREVRAFIEWPKSSCTIGGIQVVVSAAMAAPAQGKSVGSVTIIDKRLFVDCSDGSLEILKLKPAGKAEMAVQSFLAGYGSRLH